MLRLEDKGLQIIETKMLNLTKKQIKDFYTEHKKREFLTTLLII
ncbi:nucleoside-diphosphate kinase [Bisgaardia hudsonensis]